MFVYIVADNEGNIADVSASLELAQEYIDASPEDLKIIRKEVRQEPLKVEPINFATFHYSNGRNQDEEFVCNLFTGNTLSFLGNYTEFNVSSVPLTLEGD
jgi:hypothetical protein